MIQSSLSFKAIQSIKQHLYQYDAVQQCPLQLDDDPSINRIRKIIFFFFFEIVTGDILQEAVRQLQPGVKVGKILIQRDESSESKTPVLYYKKLPKDIADCFVILVDPMLATAG